MDNTVILESLSLRVVKTDVSSASDSELLKSTSIRQVCVENNSIDNKLIESAGIAVAGYEHNSGQWTPPEDMGYVIIRK